MDHRVLLSGIAEAASSRGLLLPHVRAGRHSWALHDLEWITECFCLESPKLLHHEGFYYLTSAQGGTAGPSTSHMVVSARSKSPLGPWENSPLNPIVRTWSRPEPWWSKGHGTVIEGPDDQWYIVYHGYENGYRTMGRQTLVEPVEWTDDGWYDISSPDGEEFKADSIRNYRLQSEDFEGPQLPLQWHFDGIDSTDQYSISDGAVEFDAAGDRPRVLHAIASDHNYEAEMTIDIDGSPEVGFVLYYGRDAFAGIGHLNGQAVLINGGQAVPARRRAVRWLPPLQDPHDRA